MNGINLLLILVTFISIGPGAGPGALLAERRLELKVNSSNELMRPKRYLNFINGSRMSWRINVKNNILNVNNIWAYGYGFRANFPFPANERDHKRHERSFHKHRVFETIIDLLNRHGFDGEACLLKGYCTALLDGMDGMDGNGNGMGEWSNGMLFKLLKYTFSLDVAERRRFPYLRRDYCYQILHNHCPLSFDSISSYTDDI